MFPYIAIFGFWCANKLNNYSRYSDIQMDSFCKPCKNRKTERQRSDAITTRLCYHFIWCISKIISEKPTKVNWGTPSTNTVSLSKIWPSDDWFTRVPVRNQHLYMLIHCILYQITLIISILSFFASNYYFLSCWLTITISPGINLIWNNCMFLVALSTLKIIYPADVRNNALFLILTFMKGLWISMYGVPTCVQAVNATK